MTKLKLIAIVFLIIAALGIAFHFGRITGSRNSQTDVHPVETEADDHDHFDDGELVILHPEARKQFRIAVDRAQTRAIRQSIEATGSVAVNETRVAHIRPLARGRIHDVHIRPGDRVLAGQPLLSYDNIELGEALGEYVSTLAEIGRSVSETDMARQALNRARALVELGAISQSELQRRDADYRNAVLQIEGQKAIAARIEEKLHRFGMTDAEIDRLQPDASIDYHREQSNSVLYSPQDGTVMQLYATLGQNVYPEETLASLSDLSTVWVLADVYEKDIRFVKTGGVAEVRVTAQPDRIFYGKITHITDFLDAQTRTAKVRIEVENPERLLKLEMFASISIPMPTEQQTLAVPADAVHEIDERKIVFMPKGNGFEMRDVVVGAKSGAWVEITDGLKDGEEVVTEGSFLLKSEVMKAELGHDH